ncbi:hypothetical protein SAMN05216215_1012178 [Saccharopolyspora shandongensis]|uniref:Uncharacterized protein n=1 Tax=Saccharopolyspora shandongensis TaxID=418495 RepID=A0A1H3CWM1_9PSEU|nr:DUF4064 domain-containing protein [Saccharopolyspora shandongensis]SDX58515.1 hypothetical protein SAMN05216215_1012178 [Saccharopolyspora shandongensis]
MSSPQPPDGGQQGSDPISNRMDPQDPNQAGSDATQVVRPVQPQGQQLPSDSTQVVPPSMQPPQPMYQQPGLAGQGAGAEATAMVPPSMQPPQPMYQQPGTQSQPGGFPSQPQGTPSGGFPAPQAQGGFGAPPPQAGYGQPAGQGQGSKGLALTAGWVATVIGGLGLIFNLIGVITLSATYSYLETQTAELEQYKEYGIEMPEINLPPYGLMITLYIGFLIASLVLLAGGIMVILKKNVGPILVVAASGLYAICQLVTLFTGFVTGISIAGTIVAILIAAAIGVLAFLPGTRQYIAAAGSGAPAPAAVGGYGQPGQQGGFGQPGQPQQFGQPGQQPGGFPPAGGQQPPQPPQW